MSNWEKQVIDLGSVKVGVRQKIVFQKITEQPVVLKVSASCGCSVPVFFSEQNQVIVLFTPEEIPHHLKGQGFYTSMKNIMVTYVDGTVEVLSFKCKIIR